MEAGHKTYVQVQGQYFVGACQNCEIATAEFPTRDNIEQAEEDARAHGTLEHLADRDELIAQAARAASGPQLEGRPIPTP